MACDLCPSSGGCHTVHQLKVKYLHTSVSLQYFYNQRALNRGEKGREGKSCCSRRKRELVMCSAFVVLIVPERVDREAGRAG